MGLDAANPATETPLNEWCDAWLTRACAQIQAQAGMVAMAEPGREPAHATIVALTPVDTDYAAMLDMAIQQSLVDAERSIATAPGSNEQMLVWPLRSGDAVLAVAAFVLPASTASDADARLAEQLAALAALMPQLQNHCLDAERQRLLHLTQRQNAILGGFRRVMAEPEIAQAALAFVNDVARDTQAERVALGFVRHGEVKIECQSDTSHYVHKVNTMRLTRLAMQEAADQTQSVCVPSPRTDDGAVSRAHAELSAAVDDACVASVPLIDDALQCFAVVYVERARALEAHELERLEAQANLIGQLLEDRRRAQRPMHQLFVDALVRLLQTFLRPGYLRRKVTVAALLACVLTFSLLQGDYRPGGEAVLEGVELRSVVAPFDGFIESANARAGDDVAADATLAQLDTRELRLERLRWLADSARAQRQFEDALSRNDRTQVQIHTAEVERAEAELGLLDYQINRARLAAPFAATVVNGDLSQRIGSAVRQGDPLFEIAPLDAYRLIVYINEYEIGEIAVGQSGSAILAALPDQALPVVVTRITPSAEVRGGETVYRVEATLTAASGAELRPGLVGVGRIMVDRRLLIGIWTRAARDWIRVQWWRL